MNIDIKNIKEPLNIILEDGTVVTYNSKKDVPHSWKEFLQNYPNRNDEFFISSESDIVSLRDCACINTYRDEEDKNLCKTEEEARAFRALIQLRRIWHEWCKVYGYPNWDDSIKHVIYYNHHKNTFDSMNCRYEQHSGLVFTSKEVVDQFIKDFKDLLEIAKPLL